MGAQPSRFGPFQDSVSFKPDKTSQSLNKKIKNIHVDESMFPEAGLFVIGTECNPAFSFILPLISPYRRRKLFPRRPQACLSF